MTGPARSSASCLLSAASRLLPPHLAPWARAMSRELAEIADDGAALAFAAGCLRAILALAISARLHSLAEAACALPPRFATLIRSLPTMNRMFARPRSIGLTCAAGAVAFGLASMAAAGAPSRYMIMNLAALVLGATVWLALGRLAGVRLAAAGPATLALALPLLLTALFGVAVDGASRWVSVGPLSLQVSLILLPAMLILYARQPDWTGTAGMVVAAVALAIQPDRAMAGVLAAGLLAVLVSCRSVPVIVAAAAAILAFASTLITPDSLPAVPFVDQVLYTAFEVHILAGLAVTIGAALLVLPAAVGLWRDGSGRPAFLAFGMCWAGVIAAAALGNYPTPLVGYGGSAVLGYLLSVALLPNGGRDVRVAGASLEPAQEGRSSSHSMSELRAPHPA